MRTAGSCKRASRSLAAVVVKQVEFWPETKRQTKSGVWIGVVAIVAASSNRFTESPPELQRSKRAVTLTGVAIPALEETGLPFGSPANVTIMGRRGALMGAGWYGDTPAPRSEHTPPLWVAWCVRSPARRHRKPCGCMAHHAIKWRI